MSALSDLGFPHFDREARCTAMNPELFHPFPETPAGVREAKAACGGCPWRRPCLAWALTHEEVGVWGGTTTNERTELREKHRLVVLTTRQVAALGGPTRVGDLDSTDDTESTDDLVETP